MVIFIVLCNVSFLRGILEALVTFGPKTCCTCVKFGEDLYTTLVLFVFCVLLGLFGSELLPFSTLTGTGMKLREFVFSGSFSGGGFSFGGFLEDSDSSLVLLLSLSGVRILTISPPNLTRLGVLRIISYSSCSLSSVNTLTIPVPFLEI